MSRRMSPLYRLAILQSGFGLAFLIALVVPPAGTWHYWRGWLFIAVFTATTLAFTIYLANYDKPLFERRMKAGPMHEQERSQKVISSLIIGSFFLFIIFPILDYRF